MTGAFSGQTDIQTYNFGFEGLSRLRFLTAKTAYLVLLFQEVQFHHSVVCYEHAGFRLAWSNRCLVLAGNDGSCIFPALVSAWTKLTGESGPSHQPSMTLRFEGLMTDKQAIQKGTCFPDMRVVCGSLGPCMVCVRLKNGLSVNGPAGVRRTAG